MKNLILNKNKGFTLTELLVAVSIFIIILAIATSIFTVSLKKERKIITVLLMNENLNSTLELMGREIRSSYAFNTSTYNPNFSTSSEFTELSFIGPEGDLVNYTLVSNVIYRNNKPITSFDNKILSLKFRIMQMENKCSPWRISIFIKAAPLSSQSDVKPIYLQSTVSSRILPKDMPKSYQIGNYVGCSED